MGGLPRTGKGLWQLLGNKFRELWSRLLISPSQMEATYNTLTLLVNGCMVGVANQINTLICFEASTTKISPTQLIVKSTPVRQELICKQLITHFLISHK